MDRINVNYVKSSNKSIDNALRQKDKIKKMLIRSSANEKINEVGTITSINSLSLASGPLSATGVIFSILRSFK